MPDWSELDAAFKETIKALVESAGPEVISAARALATSNGTRDALEGLIAAVGAAV